MTTWIDRERLVGSAGYAFFCTLMVAIGQLLGRDVDLVGLALVFLIFSLVGLLIWPWLGEIWAQRDKREDRKRFLAIGLGSAGGFVLTQAISALAGQDEATWTLVVWGICVAVIFGFAVRLFLWARRS